MFRLKRRRFERQPAFLLHVKLALATMQIPSRQGTLAFRHKVAVSDKHVGSAPPSGVTQEVL